MITSRSKLVRGTANPAARNLGRVAGKTKCHIDGCFAPAKLLVTRLVTLKQWAMCESHFESRRIKLGPYLFDFLQ